MAQDDELQALARARAAAPDDPRLLVRHAAALVRTGDVPTAESLLVQALDDSPGEPTVTAELDRLTGGRARGAPWPSSRGDPYRSSRSCAAGPSRGNVVFRTELALDAALADGSAFAVAAPDRALVLTRGGLYALDELGIASLVYAKPRELNLERIVLLPGGRTVLASNVMAVTLLDREGRRERVRHRYSYSSSLAVGSGGLLYTAANNKGRIDAYPIAVPSEGRTIGRTDVDAHTEIALAPGGDLVALVGGAPRANRKARLERRGSLGEPVFEVELEMRVLGRGVNGPVLGPDGVAYVGFPGKELFAIDAEGKTVFELESSIGDPAALAGADAELLVLRSERALRVLDRRTGVPRFEVGEAAFFGMPRIDARGWIYAKRGDDLVAWDPERGATPVLEVKGIAIRHWEFAFAGNGRIYAFARIGSSGTELVVIE